MSEGARVSELMTPLNWVRLIRVGSSAGFAPNFPVEVSNRGDDVAFRMLLTRISAHCGVDSAGLEAYGPPTGVDVYNEERYRLELALWTEGLFGIADEPVGPVATSCATRVAFLNMQRQFIDTLASWGLRPRGTPTEAALAIRELSGLLSAVANYSVPSQELTSAWLGSLHETGVLRPDSSFDPRERAWIRSVAWEVSKLAFERPTT